MGRKRKQDVVLDPKKLIFELDVDRDQKLLSPITQAPMPSSTSTDAYADGRSQGRPTSDIVREYVNLLACGIGCSGTPFKWLSGTKHACLVMRKHVEDKESGQSRGLSEVSTVGCLLSAAIIRVFLRQSQQHLTTKSCILIAG